MAEKDKFEIPRFHLFCWAACALFCALSMWVHIAEEPHSEFFAKVLAIFAGCYGGFGLIFYERNKHKRR